jgi:hypothetical protein
LYENDSFLFAIFRERNRFSCNEPLLLHEIFFLFYEYLFPRKCYQQLLLFLLFVVVVFCVLKRNLNPKIEFFLFLFVDRDSHESLCSRSLYLRKEPRLTDFCGTSRTTILPFPSHFFFLPNFFFHCEVKSRPTARAVYFP